MLLPCAVTRSWGHPVSRRRVAFNALKMLSGRGAEGEAGSYRMFCDEGMIGFFRRLSFTPDGSSRLTPGGCNKLLISGHHGSSWFCDAAFRLTEFWLKSDPQLAQALKPPGERSSQAGQRRPSVNPASVNRTCVCVMPTGYASKHRALCFRRMLGNMWEGHSLGRGGGCLRTKSKWLLSILKAIY